MANNYDDANGVWRTIGGRRVFIKNGQSLSDAMKASGKFKNMKEKRTTKQINDEYEKLSKEMQQDDYYYKPEDDKKLRELRAEYDQEVAKGQEDVNLTTEDIKSMSNEELKGTYDKMLKDYYTGKDFYDFGTENKLEELNKEISNRGLELSREEEIQAQQQDVSFKSDEVKFEKGKERQIDLNKSSLEYLRKEDASVKKTFGEDSEFYKQYKQQHEAQYGKDYLQYDKYNNNEIVNDDEKSLKYSFRIGDRNIFEVRYDRTGNNKNMDFATSSSELNKRRTDITRGGQAQKDLLKEGTKARDFYEKWDKKHLGTLTQKEYNELVNDIEDLKKEYPHIEGDSFYAQAQLDRDTKASKSTNKTMNDKIRNSAYKKYMKEHPNSKMTLDQFLKKK